MLPAQQKHFSMSGRGLWLNHSVFHPLSKAPFWTLLGTQGVVFGNGGSLEATAGGGSARAVCLETTGETVYRLTLSTRTFGMHGPRLWSRDRCCIHVLERRGSKEEREHTYPRGVWGIWTNTWHGHAKLGKGVPGGAGGAGGEGFQGDSSDELCFTKRWTGADLGSLVRVLLGGAPMWWWWLISQGSQHCIWINLNYGVPVPNEMCTYQTVDRTRDRETDWIWTFCESM